ncbi:TM1802 family CRISPR-associated protein, partial [Romboutsia ilealis]
MESVRNIGKFKYNSIKSEDKDLEIFTEDFSKGSKYNKALEIRILDNKKELNFKCINIREYDDSLKFKYLYRAGSSRGTDITPTAKITDIDKTYSNKIIPAIKEGIEYIDLNNSKLKEEKELLEKIYNILKEKKEDISKELKSIFDNTPKKERYYILTIVIENEDKEIYIGDFEVFKNRMKEIPMKKFYYSATNNKEVLSKDGHCSICNNKGEVFGLSSPFKFYTIDKPGYICGGFNYEDAWKNYPVCKRCAIELELGKAYLDEHLTLSFYGRKFYLIPNVIYSKDLDEILKKYENTFRKEKDQKAENMAKREDKIIEILSQEENNITFDLMFIEEKNAALNILLNI